MNDEALHDFKELVVTQVKAGDMAAGRLALEDLYQHQEYGHPMEYADLATALVKAGYTGLGREALNRIKNDGIIGPGHWQDYAELAAALIEAGQLDIFDYWLQQEPAVMSAYLFTFLEKTRINDRDLLEEAFQKFYTSGMYDACTYLIPHLSREKVQQVVMLLSDNDLSMAMKEMRENQEDPAKVEIARHELSRRKAA